MKRIIFCLLTLLGLIACQGNKQLGDRPLGELDKLSDKVKHFQQKHNIPGLGVALVHSNNIKLAVSGYRNIQTKSKLKKEDYFHLGSLTSSLTSFWAARLVEQGVLQWESTLIEIFPEWKDHALKTYHNATLEDLLSHRAKLPFFDPAKQYNEIPPLPPSGQSQRLIFAEWLVKQNPVKPNPYRNYEFSNAGIVLAAAMLEKASGQSWDEGLEELVLNPLQIKGISGWPTDVNEEQPYGHHAPNPMAKELRPVTARNMFEFAQMLAPAESYSMPLGDYAKFIQLHLRGLRKENSSLLPEQSYEKLHFGRSDYAMAWSNLKKNSVTQSSISGSSGTFYCNTTIVQEKDLAFVIYCNASNFNATQAVHQLQKHLLEIYGQ